jgi:hypothetical protein
MRYCVKLNILAEKVRHKTRLTLLDITAKRVDLALMINTYLRYFIV